MDDLNLILGELLKLSLSFLGGGASVVVFVRRIAENKEAKNALERIIVKLLGRNLREALHQGFKVGAELTDGTLEE